MIKKCEGLEYLTIKQSISYSAGCNWKMLDLTVISLMRGTTNVCDDADRMFSVVSNELHCMSVSLWILSVWHAGTTPFRHLQTVVASIQLLQSILASVALWEVVWRYRISFSYNLENYRLGYRNVFLRRSIVRIVPHYTISFDNHWFTSNIPKSG